MTPTGLSVALVLLGLNALIAAFALVQLRRPSRFDAPAIVASAAGPIAASVIYLALTRPPVNLLTASVLALAGLTMGLLAGRRPTTWAAGGRVVGRRPLLPFALWAVGHLAGVTLTTLARGAEPRAAGALAMVFGIGALIGGTVALLLGRTARAPGAARMPTPVPASVPTFAPTAPWATAPAVTRTPAGTVVANSSAGRTLVALLVTAVAAGALVWFVLSNANHLRDPFAAGLPTPPPGVAGPPTPAATTRPSTTATVAPASAATTASRPAASDSPDERLVARIAETAASRADCAPIAATADFPDATSTVVCRFRSGTITGVAYRLFADTPSADTAYVVWQNVLRDTGGRCPAGRFEGPWTHPGASFENGRRLCYVRDGTAFIVWTDRLHGVIGTAWRSDGVLPSLAAWWEVNDPLVR